MGKHLFSPDDLFNIRHKLKDIPTISKETLSDLWYVKDGHLELRRKLYYTPLLKALPENKDIRILDCGCGSGGLLQTFLRAGYHNLTGIDRSKVAIALARERCKQAKTAMFFVGDFHYLQELERLFDIIAFTEVLEHLEDDIEVLKLAQQKLAPGGYFICSVPFEQHKIGIDDDHVRSYNEKMLRERYSHIGGVEILEYTQAQGGTKHAIFTIRRDKHEG